MSQSTGAAGGVKAILRVEGLAVLALALGGYAALGGPWLWFAIAFLAPDLSMLAYLAGHRAGAAAYNAAHSYIGPAALGAAGLAGAVEWATLFALIWAAHIGMDRALGYGLKYAEHFRLTHLGLIGRERAA